LLNINDSPLILPYELTLSFYSACRQTGTIALNPIYENAKDGYHGDWTLDFKKINKHFGSLEDFKNLVQAAHDKNMKVIIDFNANHVAAEHPWLSDAKKKDWFHAKADQQNIESKWMNGLPDLNQENPEVKTYLIDAAKWWINQTDIEKLVLIGCFLGESYCISLVNHNT